MARGTQVRMDLPNGLHVSIITDGYGSEKGLYEAMVWSDDDVIDPPNDLVTEGDGLGIYGWLSPAKLGLLMERAAKLRLTTSWSGRS